MSINSAGENSHFSFHNTLLMMMVSGGLFSIASILHQMDSTVIAIWLYILAAVPVSGYVLGTYFGIKERRMWMNYERKLMHDRDRKKTNSSKEGKQNRTRQQEEDDYPYKPQPEKAERVSESHEDLT